ncbi:MAG TPA: response regulator transcription factor [Ktedonobacteraceae bacterium]|nr:response regulator transcription factor [Ktedonobacteraceae bacterium]
MAQGVTTLQFRGTGDQTTSKDSLSIILVDSHLLTRLALQQVIATFKHMHISASLSAVHDVLAITDPSKEQIVVLSPSIAISDCLALTKQLHEQRVRCEVVVLQQDLHPETARMLVKQGVHGLLDEHASEQDLVQAIRTVSLGHVFLSRHIRALLSTPLPPVTNHLTRREIQVLTRLKCGEANFRIACELGLKEKTIEKYLTSIYEKLHVCSRAEAILCLQKMHF